jgi:membrane-bound metal-dependent hydrolase YbcI (DUF457 family)
MIIASIAAGVFIAAFIVHWIIWRVRMPARQSAALLAIFMGTLLLALAGMVVLPAVTHLPPMRFWACLHVAIFHTAMTLAYLVAYTGIEERSPSMALLTHVAQAGGQGRTREELVAVLKGFDPVHRRLASMLRDKMTTEETGVYSLTPKGRHWASVFSTWRRLIGISKGG